MRAVYQIDDPAGAHINGRVLIAPDAPALAAMVAQLRDEIAPCVAVEVVSEADLVIPVVEVAVEEVGL